jgi:transcriptional regulator with XRE-family HTH domain
MSQAKSTLGPVVGRNMRHWRLERGQTQDDLALLLRLNGVAWSRSNVAALESGRHQDVGLATVFAIAQALEVGLDALVQGADDELLRIAHGRKGRRKPHYSPEGQQARQTRHDLEADAARRLGTTVERIRSLADQLYGQPLADQREAQLPKGLENTVSARRGHRGRVTRRLLAELKDAHEVLKEEEK